MQKSKFSSAVMGLAIGAAGTAMAMSMSKRNMNKIKHGAERAMDAMGDIVSGTMPK